MSELPPDFLPDLCAVEPRAALEGSLWRHPALVEHTYGRLYRAVRGLLDPPCDVLDLGCGTGYMALELAREGCRVLGIDSDELSIELAERARDADPLLRDRSALTYQVADLASWDAAGERFDAVVASRILHHLTDPKAVVERMAGWLRPGGRLVCVVFGYDRFDRRSAAWLYQVGGLLQTLGLLPPDDHLGDDPVAGVEGVWERWWTDHEEDRDLNPLDQLLEALRGPFREERLTPLPYLSWEVLEELEAPFDLLPGIARFLIRLETHLVTEAALPALLFSWAGRPEGTSGWAPDDIPT